MSIRSLNMTLTRKKLSLQEGSQEELSVKKQKTDFYRVKLSVNCRHYGCMGDLEWRESMDMDEKKFSREEQKLGGPQCCGVGWKRSECENDRGINLKRQRKPGWPRKWESGGGGQTCGGEVRSGMYIGRGLDSSILLYWKADAWQMLGDIFSCHDGGQRVSLASSGKRPGVLLNTLQCRKEPPKQGIIGLKMSAEPRLSNPGVARPHRI